MPLTLFGTSRKDASLFDAFSKHADASVAAARMLADLMDSRRAQLLSAGLYSLGHGGNDAQKTMGIIVAALVASGHVVAARPGEPQHVPLWAILACHGAMALGTMTGGWRIVKTMGMKITKLAPVGRFSAETAGAATLFLATVLRIPVSTTHHHGGGRRCRVRSQALRRPLGGRAEDRMGVGVHRSVRGGNQCARPVLDESIHVPT